MDPISPEAAAAIETAARALGIPIRPEWHDGIARNLQISLRLARDVAAFPLGDTAELAPTFRA